MDTVASVARNKAVSNQVKGENKEIDELAELIRQRNEKALQKKTIKTSTIQAVPTQNSDVKGRFGWGEISKTVPVIPYILRGPLRLVSMRIFNDVIASRFIGYFTSEVLDCMPNSFIIPKPEEIDLYNEINIKHSDCYFGKALFTNKDLFQTLDDCVKRFKFLEFCYNSIIARANDNKDYGFVNIDNQHLVPYVSQQGIKRVPMFYFEGESSYLDKAIVTLTGWDLSYMKFLCKVQQIKRNLYEGDVKVVSLDELTKLFPPDTTFSDGWPNNLANSDLIRKEQGVKLPSNQLVTTKKLVHVPQVVQNVQTIPRPSAPVIPKDIPKPSILNGNSSLLKSKSLATAPEAKSAPPLVPLANKDKEHKYFCYVPLIAYQGVLTYIGGKKIVGVNLRPYDKELTLVCVEDIWLKLFLRNTLDQVLTAVGKMGIPIVKINEAQTKVLKDVALKKLDHFTTLTCVNLKQFIAFFNQIQKQLAGASQY